MCGVIYPKCRECGLNQPIVRPPRDGGICNRCMRKKMPDFPRTPYVPYKYKDTVSKRLTLDRVATKEEAEEIFNSHEVRFEEKIDGSNIALRFEDDLLFVKNRRGFLDQRGLLDGRGSTKDQYSPIWNFAYSMKDNFDKLEKYLGFTPTVYGEWVYARHTISYDLLPSYFIGFDIYYEKGEYFLNPMRTATALGQCGFYSVPMLYTGELDSWEKLESRMNEKSVFSTTDLAEGIYIKASDGYKITHRFKMVRDDFMPGKHWDDGRSKRNSLRDKK